MEFEIDEIRYKVNEDGRMVSIRPSEYYYRNLGDVELTFPSMKTLIIGKNAQGKRHCKRF